MGFALAFLVAAASAKDIRLNLLAPPTELEYGFCDGSPEPLTFDVISVAPFPILVQNGATITLEVQITLNEEVAVGAQVDLNLVLEGIISIRLPLPHLCPRGSGLRPPPWTRSLRRWRPPDSRTHRVHPRHPPPLPQGHSQGRGHSD